MPPRPGAGFQVYVDVENLDHWVRRIAGASKIVSHETQISLVAMGSHLKPSIQDKTPVDLGKLKRAIDFKVERQGRGVWGLDLHAGGVKYAIFVERGTRPHWPPPGALKEWADRHGIPEFLVARAIARHGTIKRFGRPGPAGAEMFERTLDEEEGWINRERERLGENIVKGIVSS